MQAKISRTQQRLLALSLVAIAIVIVTTGLLTRRSKAEQLKEHAISTVPTVTLLSPADVTSGSLELPARIEPWARALIYARVSGYLKNWKVDIGSAVKAGQLLAEIETPELDQQLLQARAELATAKSNLALATSTSKRWQELLAADAVSKQEADEKTGDLAAKQSIVNALQANVERFQSTQAYTRLLAPFDGVITARNTDLGALINVGGAPGSELFVVSDIRRLRVYVNVPQRQVTNIRSGSNAQLIVPERPGRNYSATVQSLSQAINAASGTMLVQLSVNNAGEELLPGGYASLRFDLPATAGAVSVSPGALIFNKSGTQVATVNSENRVALKRVTIARDLGNTIELASGLDRNDKVIANPPDGVANGDQVRIAENKKVTS